MPEDQPQLRATIHDRDHKRKVRAARCGGLLTDFSRSNGGFTGICYVMVRKGGAGFLALALLSLACQTSKGRGGGAGQGTGHRGGGGTGGAGSGGGNTGGIDAGGSGGVDAADLSSVDLTGAPIYTRVQRLTNRQWENAVTDVLRFQQRHELSKAFTPPLLGITAFDNNEQVLFVDPPRFIDFESGAEAAAAVATGSRPDALAALYAGDDVAGFVRDTRAARVPSPAQRRRRRPSIKTSSRSVSVSTARALRMGHRSSSGACFSHRISSTALNSGQRGTRSVLTSLRRSFHFGCSGPRRATRSSTRPLPERSTSADGLVAVANQMLDDPRALSVMRDFHGQLLHVSRFESISKPGVAEYDAAINPELALASYAFFDLVFQQDLGLRGLRLRRRLMSARVSHRSME